MTGPVPLPSAHGQESPRGLWAELLGLTGSFGRHIQALVALAGIEGKEAAALYLRVAIAVGAALVLLLFGYLLLLLFVAFLLATVFQIAWMWIALGLGVLHLIGVAGCVFYAKEKLKSPVFTETSVELRKDFNSLKEFKG